MHDQVLTNEEIARLADRWKYTFPSDAIRAVEAAVLAKRPAPPKPIYEMWLADEHNGDRERLEAAGYVQTYGCIAPGTKFVSEVEARERERAAWDAGLKAYFHRHLSAFNFHNHTWQGTKTIDCDKDRTYPSLKPVEPPPLVLSTGRYTPRTTLAGRRVWQDGGGCDWRTPPVETLASDARALADWLEKYGT